MGQVFGYNGVKEPPFKALWRKGSMEIRRYEPIVVAEIPVINDRTNEAFMALAEYIGVFGTAKNQQAKAVAMTAPVITAPQPIAMTAPVITASERMQFVLPDEYKSKDATPIPANDRIEIKEVPAKCVAVSQFTGSFSKPYFTGQLEELYQSLRQEGILEDGDINADEFVGGLRWNFAQYNPPFTLPFCRRNEVWLELTQRAVDKLTQEDSNPK